MEQKNEALLFCENVKKIRIKNALTQDQMAKKLKIGIKTLSLLERGEIPPRLSCAVFVRIGRIFHIPIKNLFLPME